MPGSPYAGQMPFMYGTTGVPPSMSPNGPYGQMGAFAGNSPQVPLGMDPSGGGNVPMLPGLGMPLVGTTFYGMGIDPSSMPPGDPAAFTAPSSPAVPYLSSSNPSSTTLPLPMSTVPPPPPSNGHPGSTQSDASTPGPSGQTTPTTGVSYQHVHPPLYVNHEGKGKGRKVLSFFLFPHTYTHAFIFTHPLYPDPPPSQL